jgi:hypothetical protein
MTHLPCQWVLKLKPSSTNDTRLALLEVWFRYWREKTVRLEITDEALQDVLERLRRR